MQTILIVVAICVTIIILTLILCRNSKHSNSKRVTKKYDLKEIVKESRHDHFNLNVMSDGSYQLEYYNDEDLGDGY